MQKYDSKFIPENEHENDVMLKTSRDKTLSRVAHSGGYGLLLS